MLENFANVASFCSEVFLLRNMFELVQHGSIVGPSLVDASPNGDEASDFELVDSADGSVTDTYAGSVPAQTPYRPMDQQFSSQLAEQLPPGLAEEAAALQLHEEPPPRSPVELIVLKNRWFQCYPTCS